MAIKETKGAVTWESQEGGAKVGSWGSPGHLKSGPSHPVTQGLEEVPWGLSLGCVTMTSWLPACEVSTIMVPHPMVDVSIS